MSEQNIRIVLRAYEHAILDRSANEIVRTAQRTGADIRGPIPLPTKKTVYTVLRSPHVDKKSREQFQVCVHKRLIDIIRPPQQAVDAVLKVELPAGVHAEAKPF
ncbi:MAG: 30S ribosomal protein S10 [Candidatus Latescibacterota bacterium]|nr:MAG: 30S ribosomal protein S10 [Candidatus Latescibacterota bacterium]